MNFLFKASHKRTMFLALLATATFVGSAIYMFDVETELLIEFFVASVLCVLAIILLALLLTGLRILLRRFLG